MSKIKAALGRQLDRLSGATKLIGAAFIGALLAGSLAWAAGSRVTLVDMDGNYVDASKTSAQDSNVVSVSGDALALGATTASNGIPIALPTDQSLSISGSVTASGTLATTVADAANVTLGAKADAKSAATDTTAVTAMQVLKEISDRVQALATLTPVSQAGTCTGVIPINQTSSTDLITPSAKLHICSIILVSASQQGISLEEGTGSTCGTSTDLLLGGAGGTMQVLANGGFSAVSGVPWLHTITAAEHLCLIQSGAGNISGVITYVDN